MLRLPACKIDVFNVLPKILNAFHSRNKISVTANQGGSIVSIVLGKAKHIHCNIYVDALFYIDAVSVDQTPEL